MINVDAAHFKEASGAVRVFDQRKDPEVSIGVILLKGHNVARAPAQERGAGKAPQRGDDQHAGNSFEHGLVGLWVKHLDEKQIGPSAITPGAGGFRAHHAGLGHAETVEHFGAPH
jgi:hypothetical protein